MTKRLIVKADRVFSPHKGFLHNYCLVIQNTVVEEIISHPEIKAYDEILDFSGYTLSSPFCDYHLHFSQKNMCHIKKITSSLLRAGILKVFEGGDYDSSGLMARGMLKGTIKVLTAGAALCKKGGYGKFLGSEVRSVKEARSVIHQLCVQDVDYIKVVNSGIFLPHKNEFSRGGFAFDELKEIISMAHNRALKVKCHANSDRTVREAVEAGVNMIVHGFGVSDDTLSLMAEKQVEFIPTVNALYSLCTIKGNYPFYERIKKITDQHLKTIKRAFEKGVKVLPGSDSGPSFIPYGEAYSGELAFFKKASVHDEKIFGSAAFGVLLPGREANFIVLEGLNVKKVFYRGTELLL